MKKFTYAFLLFTILLILNGCSNNTKNNIKSIIDMNKSIEKIQISLSFPFTSPAITKDKDKIQEIVNCINGLKLKETKDKGGIANGAYDINIFFDDGTEKEFFIFGRKYFQVGRDRYEITEEEAQEFLEFYYSISKSEN